MYSMSLAERVISIKKNDNEINKLVEEYKAFIASSAEKVLGRFVKYGEDDELSISLLAFVEAIKAFDNSKGNFLSFAQKVIKRRLIDYYRKERRYTNAVCLHDNTNNSEDENDIGIIKSIEAHAFEENNEYWRLELDDFKLELLEWGVNFDELMKEAPKQIKSREILKSILNFLLSRPDLIKVVKTKKTIPISLLEECLKLPRKKIERLKKVIIAGFIIATGDYQYIKKYI